MSHVKRIRCNKTMTKYFVFNLCEEGEEEMFLESDKNRMCRQLCSGIFESNVREDLVMSQETVMSLASGAAAEQGNTFYMSDKVTWPRT